MPLNGKYALITGSSRGIGRAIALKLAEHGVNVAIHYYKNEAAANDTLLQVRQRGADGFIVQADVLQPEDINHMFSQVKDNFGKLDIFVSSARPDLQTFCIPSIFSRANAATGSVGSVGINTNHQPPTTNKQLLTNYH
jgi:NAD(P)-dependent dehydrogenase (short-subunit alcohol dehydrogenase family)